MRGRTIRRVDRLEAIRAGEMSRRTARVDRGSDLQRRALDRGCDRIGPGPDLRAVRTRRLGRRLDRRHPGDRALLRRPADSHRRRGRSGCPRSRTGIARSSWRTGSTSSSSTRTTRSFPPASRRCSESRWRIRRWGSSSLGAGSCSASGRTRSTSSGPGRTQTSTKASGGLERINDGRALFRQLLDANSRPTGSASRRRCSCPGRAWPRSVSSTLAWSRSSIWSCGAGRCSATASASSIGSSRRTFTTVIR